MVSFETTAFPAATTLFAAALALAPDGLAQNAQWREVPAVQAPPLRSGFTFVPWDSGEMLLFGGDTTNPTATEWSWDGIAWRTVTTPVPRRRDHAMAQDPATGELLLFGGVGATFAQLTDTWRYANGAWTQLSPATSPPPALVHPTLAYDPADQSMLLVADGPIGQDVWRFQNGNWASVPSATLPAGLRTAFTDSVRGEADVAIAAGGATEIFRLEGSTWVAVAAPLPLPAIATFDADRGRAVLVQGTPTTLDTGEFDGVHFVSFGSTTLPNANLPLLALAYHPMRRETLALRGNVSPMNSTIDVLRWAPAPTPLTEAYGAPCQDPTFALGLVAGDSPQPGASHRLAATGQNGAFATISVLGLSHTQNAGQPLPQLIPLGPASCLLRVEASLFGVLGVGLPQTQLLTLPNSPLLLGERYDAQLVQFDATGVRDTSNGLEVQIGLPLPENQLVETFATAQNRDPIASGDTWVAGQVQPAVIGGDGRHGSFDATFGVQVAPDVYRWNTDSQVIPASATLDGSPALVTDGRFYFTDLVVPAGVTVRFVGAAPAQLFVRGRCDVQGTISVDADDLPFALPAGGTAPVSNFNARGPTGTQAQGQAGGLGGAGGGQGGRGGIECLNQGPIFSGSVRITDGQPGEDVRVSAGHAYAASATDTGGRGSAMEPASGVSPFTLTPPLALIAGLYLPFVSPGGGGGGHAMSGAPAALPVLPGVLLSVAPQASGGLLFPLLPYPTSPPPGYSSLEHFAVGGSGGGGGGSHGFGLFGFPGSTERWMAGHGGSGGGGALAVRAGGNLTVAGAICSRGGEGVLISGDNPATLPVNLDFGISSPGGGGSGGTVLLQSAADVAVTGQLDTSGGAGSRTGMISTTQLAALQAQAGAGATGYYRLEAAGSANFGGTGVPVYSPAANQGPLNDRDDRTGSRSRWLLPAAVGLPVYLRYELLVAINGVPVLYSDDAAVSPLAANDPNGIALLRFQGARIDSSTGQPVPGSAGPWRTALIAGDESLNRDRAETLRFDLVLDKSVGPVQVLELRIVWR